MAMTQHQRFALPTSVVFLIMGLIFVATGPSVSADADKSRVRLEELFKWKVSDTLQLAPAEEEKFSQILKDVADRRHKAFERMDQISSALSKAPTTKETEKLIGDYQKQFKAYTEAQLYEIDALKKLFGSEKMGRYIVLKDELTNKLKS